jgi:hypothetical protein
MHITFTQQAQRVVNIDGKIHVQFININFSLWFRASHINMYKYIQRDATVSWLLFKELYIFRAFTMPFIRI